MFSNSEQQIVQRISAFGINTNWNTDRHKKHSHISSYKIKTISRDKTKYQQQPIKINRF